MRNIEKTKFSVPGGSLNIDGLKSGQNIARISDPLVNTSISLYLILDEEFNISSHVGILVNGVIGYPFFNNSPISIDYASQKISVF